MAFEERFDAFDRQERVIRARASQDKHNLVYHIFTGCQMISCKYKYLNGLRGMDFKRGEVSKTASSKSEELGTDRKVGGAFLWEELRVES